MREESDTPDAAVARIAGRQHGVVTAERLRPSAAPSTSRSPTPRAAPHGGEFTTVSFHADHERDLDLRRLGYTVLRYTEGQLEDAPERIVTDVAAALAP